MLFNKKTCKSYMLLYNVSLPYENYTEAFPFGACLKQSSLLIPHAHSTFFLALSFPFLLPRAILSLLRQFHQVSFPSHSNINLKSKYYPISKL